MYAVLKHPRFAAELRARYILISSITEQRFAGQSNSATIHDDQMTNKERGMQMGHTCNSIVINAPYDLVFDISNHIERWTELFGDEYVKAEILNREGNKITFRLTDDEGKSWISFRLLLKDNYFAYAQRQDPLFPFRYMKIIWLYTPIEEGIKMTWIQDFEMDSKAKFNDAKVEGFINKHSHDNMRIFKEVMEKEAEQLATKN